jgi:sucrose-6-phosphate hydrolase SacC (GH32 family)
MLTEVPIAGADMRRSRWVLKVGLNPGGLQGGSGEQYFVGGFDGVRFVNDNRPSTTLWTDYGKDCYCALPFNNLPLAEPPVMLGWMNNWQYAGKLPTAPWRGQMTVPRRLQLRDGPAGLRLLQHPVEVLQTLRQNRYSWTGTSVAGLNSAMRAHPAREAGFELHAQLPVASNAETGWRLVGSNGIVATVSYDPQKQQLVVDRIHSGATEFSPQFPAIVAAPLRRARGPLEQGFENCREALGWDPRHHGSLPLGI